MGTVTGRRLGLRLSLALASLGAGATASSATVLGFEATSDWHLTEGNGALTSVAAISEGAHSLQVGATVGGA